MTPLNKNTPAAIYTQLLDWIELIKFEHTVFALPFALSGFILASNGIPNIAKLIWTIIAFTGARTAAMSLNRVIDADIDAVNPRTKLRAIPQGKIKKNKAILLAIISFLVMLLAASQLPPLCMVLSPIAIVWLSLYSYSKRATPLCHLVLGIALGGAALGGWIAAGGNLASVTIWFLAAAVACWVAGFDIIYACQDQDFDVKEKIFSIPAKYGIDSALKISKLLHLITVICLIYVGLSGQLGLIYWLGVTIISAMLIYEHSLVSASDLSKVNAAFFTTNGIVSILAFVCILVDHLSRN